MAEYRIIFHDEHGSPVAESTVIHRDDEAVIDDARRHSHPCEIAIWQGDRLVARVPPMPRTPRGG